MVRNAIECAIRLSSGTRKGGVGLIPTRTTSMAPNSIGCEVRLSSGASNRGWSSILHGATNYICTHIYDKVNVMKRHKVIRRTWTHEEDEYLRSHSHKMHYKDLAIHLKRAVGSVSKRVRFLGLSHDVNRSLNRLEKNGYGRDVLQQVVIESYSVMEVVRKLGKTSCGPTYKIILKAIDEYGLDCSHFDPWKYKVPTFSGKSIEEYLVYGSTIGSNTLKKRLYKEGLKKRQCEKCGQGEDWHGEKMSLILDHINGNPKDNQLENLRIVCPNCNATLATHCRGKKAFVVKPPTEVELQREKNGGRTDKETAFSMSQRRATRPNKDILLLEVEELGFVGVGRKYGVSDNSIRKWLK